MGSDAPKFPRSTGVVTLTSALAGAIATVGFATYTDALRQFGDSGRWTLIVALVGAVASACIAACSIRRSAAHVFVYGAMAGAWIAGALVLFVWLPESKWIAHVPTTFDEMLGLVIDAGISTILLFFVTLYGAVMGVVGSLFHILPIAFAVSEERTPSGTSLSRIVLMCSAWLVLVSGGVLRIALHSSDPQHYALIGSSVGLVAAVGLAIAGFVGLGLSTYERAAPWPS